MLNEELNSDVWHRFLDFLLNYAISKSRINDWKTCYGNHELN